MMCLNAEPGTAPAVVCGSLSLVLPLRVFPRCQAGSESRVLLVLGPSTGCYGLPARHLSAEAPPTHTSHPSHPSLRPILPLTTDSVAGPADEHVLLSAVQMSEVAIQLDDAANA